MRMTSVASTGSHGTSSLSDLLALLGFRLAMIMKVTLTFEALPSRYAPTMKNAATPMGSYTVKRPTSSGAS